MTDIVKGVLGGGLALVAGWILPTALNLLLIGVLVLPSVEDAGVWGDLADMSTTGKAALLLGAAVVGGLVLNMLQTPLYRVLEGYLLWPQWAFESRSQRHRDKKHEINKRLTLIKQFRTEVAETSSPDETDAQRRERVAMIGRKSAYREMKDVDRRRTGPQRALLREELRRYPVDDDQVIPTRLGNSIRRFEEYGWNHYRLDSQALWSRLVAVVPEPVRKQLDNAQIGVDFFVCLLWGNVIVTLGALTAFATGARSWNLLIAVIVPVALIPVWYRLAVVTTDQWAAAVQALVDLGRQPFAKGLGLTMPATIDEEREMWEQVSRFARREYQEGRAKSLDRFRAKPGAEPSTDAEPEQ